MSTLVVGSAFLAAGLRGGSDPPWWLALLSVLSGPLTGAWLDLSWGGKGLRGGALGGAIGFTAIILAHRSPAPDLGTLEILLAMAIGAAFGLFVGLIAWGLKVQIEDKDSPYPWWPREPPEPPE